MRGENRPNWPVEQLAQLSPGARIEIIEGAGHYLWLAHATALRAAIRPFVRSVANSMGDVQ